MKQITSAQNPLVKSLLQLQEKSRARRQSGQFLMEGKREIALALKGGYGIEMLLFNPAILTEKEARSLAPNADLIEIAPEVYHKVAYRESTEGLIAVGTAKKLELSDLELPENPLIIVAEGLEKPGNIGALLRTADAAKVDAVIIADAKSDLYNPNIIRSSVGCVFTNQIALARSQDAIAFLKERHIPVYGATLQAAVPYHRVDFTTAAALAVGTEASGLTPPWRDAAEQNIIIPMGGQIDSMNVSVAAAILIFEARRQRGFA